MSNFTLDDIYIGCTDGVKEAASKKYNFTDLFYTGNCKYEEITKSNNYIISGRKGTGKTILAKYLEKMQVASVSATKAVLTSAVALPIHAPFFKSTPCVCLCCCC